MFRLMPDRIFNSITEIDGALLQSEGVRGLVLDIDNTMAPRHVPLPDEALMRWIQTLADADVKLFIVSNNRRDRVARFADALGLPFIRFGMKPFPQSFRRAVRRMDLTPRDVAAVGDQIFTDICGAHLAGLRAWLVAPLDRNETASFRIRRALEAPVLRRYYRAAAKKEAARDE